MYRRAQTVRLLSLLLWLGWCQAQNAELPPFTSCPDNFGYDKLKDGSGYDGIILLPDTNGQQLEVTAAFSRNSVTDFKAAIVPYPSEQSVMNDLRSARPVMFLVHFSEPHKPPKLVQLTMNGVDICSDTNYPPPNFWFQTTYRLEVGLNMGKPLPLVPEPPRPKPTKPRPITKKPKDKKNKKIEKCGIEGTAIRPLVYGGSAIMRGQFPWLTSIYSKRTDTLKYLCVGSLISLRSVITAAHCFEQLTAAEVLLFLGRHDLLNFAEAGMVTRDVQQLIKHPDYKRNMPDADVAVLRMEALASYTSNIQPICLWSPPTSLNPIIGKLGTVAGWGADEQGQLLTSVAKMVQVTIASEVDCLRSSPVYGSLLTNRTFCAGARDGTGPCKGDSGSGLMLNQNGSWMLRGVVSIGQSRGFECNLQEYVVYCDVAKHLSWIKKNL